MMARAVPLPIADPPGWARDYIGIPFLDRGRDRRGADCWGLLRLVLAERFAIAVPAYDDGYTATESEADRIAIERLMQGGLPDWRGIAPGEERAGDGVLLRIMGRPVHVGVVAARGWMLHTEQAVDAVLECYADAKWRRRVLGFYRWAGGVP